LPSAVNALADRANDQGSALYNKIKNEDLEKEIRSLERLVESLKEDLKQSENRNQELRARVRGKIGLLVPSLEEENNNTITDELAQKDA